jgi:hypothetical protein
MRVMRLRITYVDYIARSCSKIKDAEQNGNRFFKILMNQIWVLISQ